MVKNIRNLRMTSGTCPSAWVAQTEDREEIYIRYRWGALSVWIEGRAVFNIQHGDDFDGTMDTETMLELTGFEVVE